MNKLLIKSDLDILDLVDLSLEPVDRLGQADYIPFFPEISLAITNKVIIINRWFEDCTDLLRELSKQNKIINRVPDYDDFDLRKYSIDNRLIISSTTDTVSLTDAQKVTDIRIILLDDLIITDKRLCLEWN